MTNSVDEIESMLVGLFEEWGFVVWRGTGWGRGIRLMRDGDHEADGWAVVCIHNVNHLLIYVYGFTHMAIDLAEPDSFTKLQRCFKDQLSPATVLCPTPFVGVGNVAEACRED